tara:strand:+ start:2821 stop:2970 length:150 start_codon:yes stop_codon:yes gene_type:complete
VRTEKLGKIAKKVSWMWGGKRYYGEKIREDDKYVYARTHNNKVKKIKKS